MARPCPEFPAAVVTGAVVPAGTEIHFVDHEPVHAGTFKKLHGKTEVVSAEVDVIDTVPIPSAPLIQIRTGPGSGVYIEPFPVADLGWCLTGKSGRAFWPAPNGGSG